MKLQIVLVLAAAIGASGCALFRGSVDSCTYRFPERFDALQVVRVVQVEKGEFRELLASVRRSGEDYEFALLDPVFQRPLVEASFVNGQYREQRSLPPEVKLEAWALFDSLRELFSAECFSPGERGLRLTSSRFFYEFKEPAAGSCAFPERIFGRARGGFDLEVTAVTEDVVCGP